RRDQCPEISAASAARRDRRRHVRFAYMTAIALPSLIDRLRRAVGPENVLAAQSDLVVYECDGFTIEKNSPDVVVFPNSTEDVAEVVKICERAGVPFLPRGAGTSL